MYYCPSAISYHTHYDCWPVIMSEKITIILQNFNNKQKYSNEKKKKEISKAAVIGKKMTKAQNEINK